MSKSENSVSFEIGNGRVVVVSLEDFESVSRFNWYARENYIYSKAVGYLHRFLMSPGRSEVVDHINGDPLDNRRENLRVCSPGENSRNQKRRSDNSSGYKGVFWEKACGKWRVQIKVGGKTRHIGVFDRLEDAARAYNEAALSQYGDFARINEGVS